MQLGDFVDKHNIPARKFTPEHKVRIVPGGSSVRRGAYVSEGVIIMPPAYVNIGAYIDCGTMVDSNALVGSCAQIRKKRTPTLQALRNGGVLGLERRALIIIEDNNIGAGFGNC